MKKTVKFKTKINTTAILAVLAFSAFIALFNETILNIALNILMNEMNAAIGSSLFIGIMSASQQKALNNSVSTQTAVAAGFSAAVLALAGFVLVGFCLSFTLGFKNEKLSFNLSHKNTKNNRLS
ncbi:hypothetical protein D4Z93_01950 [Clostridium fermenticellae]|uniref:Uncharacterized protein n=1 Tax=Clostridium fermenticellae TaxID=2068654 RepID=A0A386H134_9CLOT|nr:hypothetical protein [Clostridium fermenticellae]AYD39370.1 hypothetical protein D4Z93_01950 [Clostridium fermenticellae]